MKKIILFLITAVFFMSCEQENEDPIDSSSENTSLIGTWQLTENIQNNISAELDECQLQNTLVFTENTATTVGYTGFYNFDTGNVDCYLTSDATVNYSIDGSLLTFSDEYSSIDMEYSIVDNKLYTTVVTGYESIDNLAITAVYIKL